MENLVNMFEIYKGKKVFVTGHTGFKGTWLLKVLQYLGADSYGFALEPNTSPSHFSLLNGSKNSVIGDILNLEALKESIIACQPEIVFHMAAQPLVRESYKNPINTYKTNVIGTLNLLEAVKECSSVKTIVVITTDKVYDNKEWVYPYRETDQLGGYDIYSSSKACTEILVQSFQRSFFPLGDYGTKHKLLIATARAGNVIGGGDWSRDRLIPDIVKAAECGKICSIRNPTAIRPWQHVLDCLTGYLMLGEKLLNENSAFAEAWNFAPNVQESCTVANITTISKSIWDKINVEFSHDDLNLHEASILKLDNTKAITKLNWKPNWDTKTAIVKTIDWYKEYYTTGQISTDLHIREYFNSL